MKYKIEIQENINLFGAIELLKFIINYLQEDKKLEIDDSIMKIPDNIKKHFKEDITK